MKVICEHKTQLTKCPVKMTRNRLSQRSNFYLKEVELYVKTLISHDNQQIKEQP